MQFCTTHSKDLETAFASLSLNASASDDQARNPPVAIPAPQTGRQQGTPFLQRNPPSFTRGQDSFEPPDPSEELSNILLALRKLREALLATSTSAVSPVFSQRVHVFSIRLAILAFHPPSYYPSLLHLLFVLHTPVHPLPSSELSEMTTYLILDLACRQNALSSAYSFRAQRRVNQKYENKTVDAVLHSMITNNWIAFWSTRRKVDGYIRAILRWAVDDIRRTSLKAIGRTYLSCDVTWVLSLSTGGEWTWEDLKEKEKVGWLREGDNVIVRKIKPKAATSGSGESKSQSNTAAN